MGIVLDCIMGFFANTIVALLQILLETDDKVGSLLVPVEVSSMRSEAGTTGEDSVTETARELDVVNVLCFKVVLQVGRLRGFVGSEADSALDDGHPLHLRSVNHAFQHRLILLFACKGLR